MDDLGEREFALTVFGVTGYTGKLVVKYLDRLAQEGKLEGTRICFAGRNTEAMHDVCKTNCSSALTPAFCVANVRDEQSIYSMVANTRVLLQLVGPYEALGGEVVIKACVSLRTHYVDITGEGKWIDRMQQVYGGIAQRNQVCLVPFAGQDCVPADLSAWFTTTQLDAVDFAESHATLQTLLQLPGRGGRVSNGTFKTIINQNGLDFNVPEGEALPFTRKLSEGVSLVKVGGNNDSGEKLAVLPIRFFPDFRVVRDSHRALGLGGKFENTHSLVLPNRALAYATSFGLRALPYLLQLPLLRTLLDKVSDSGASFSPRPSNNGPVQYSTYGVLKMYPLNGGDDSLPIETVVTRLDCDRDPYEVTAICCVQVALALAEQQQVRAGFQTPVTAVGGQDLLERCYECFRVQLLSKI